MESHCNNSRCYEKRRRKWERRDCIQKRAGRMTAEFAKGMNSWIISVSKVRYLKLECCRLINTQILCILAVFFWRLGNFSISAKSFAKVCWISLEDQHFRWILRDAVRDIGKTNCTVSKIGRWMVSRVVLSRYKQSQESCNSIRRFIQI